MSKVMNNIPALVPEFYVSDLEKSISFYGDILEFEVAFKRQAERFAYLTREGAHLMLEEITGPGRKFTTAQLEYPFGRGVNLQIRVSDVTRLYNKATKSKVNITLPLEERWYQQDDVERGNMQFVMADPDGYLLRPYESLGVKKLR